MRLIFLVVPTKPLDCSRVAEDGSSCFRFRDCFDPVWIERVEDTMPVRSSGCSLHGFGIINERTSLLV